jgi:hypothetical protein
MTAPDQSGITDLSLLRQRGRPHMTHYPLVEYVDSRGSPFGAELTASVINTNRRCASAADLLTLAPGPAHPVYARRYR